MGFLMAWLEAATDPSIDSKAAHMSVVVLMQPWLVRQLGRYLLKEEFPDLFRSERRKADNEDSEPECLKAYVSKKQWQEWELLQAGGGV